MPPQLGWCGAPGIPSHDPRCRCASRGAGATVSKVLNDRYDVASTTRLRVQAAIAELNYEVSLGAQSLRSGPSNVLGILVPILESFQAELILGAASAARKAGYELLVYSASNLAKERPGWERRYLSRLGGRMLGGAILLTATTVDLDYPIPLVAIDPHPGVAVPSVKADDVGARRVLLST